MEFMFQIKLNLKIFFFTSIKVIWKIDDINIENIDKNNIRFKLEIKKEKTNENCIKFMKVLIQIV